MSAWRTSEYLLADRAERDRIVGQMIGEFEAKLAALEARRCETCHWYEDDEGEMDCAVPGGGKWQQYPPPYACCNRWVAREQTP